MIQDHSIYCGEVVHVRLRPRLHKLRYRVFSLLVDVDRIDALARRLRLLSHNRFNLYGICDRDHGPGDGTPIAAHARKLLAAANVETAGGRILLLAYPRMLGTVFNPLSVYYAYDAAGALVALIYEVDNTVGERKCYVLHAGPARNGAYAHGCAKELYVSPFAPADGRYGFRVTEPGCDLLVAVQLHDRDGALIRTHFRGSAEPLTDRALARMALRYPLPTAKVLGGIHLEALKLWLKGVPVVQRHRSPRYSVTIVPASEGG